MSYPPATAVAAPPATAVAGGIQKNAKFFYKLA